MQLDDWEAVDFEIDRVIAEGAQKPFDSETIANVREFVNSVRENCPPPEVGKGYWNAIRFCWATNPPIEIEVFRDRFELYRIYDGHTDIRHIAHVPGSPFPAEILAELPRYN